MVSIPVIRVECCKHIHVISLRSQFGATCPESVRICSKRKLIKREQIQLVLLLVTLQKNTANKLRQSTIP